MKTSLPTDQQGTFPDLTKRLFDEIIWGHTCLKIGKALAAAADEDETLSGVSPIFFSAVSFSLAEAAQMCAAKLFDKKRGTETIAWMLQEADKHAGCFQASPGEVRKEVEAARNQLATIEPQVEAVLARRNKVLAHRDRETLIDPMLAEKVKLTISDLDRIFETVAHTINRFEKIYDGRETYPELLNWDDYKDVVDLIAKGQCADIREFESKYNTPWPGVRPRGCS